MINNNSSCILIIKYSKVLKVSLQHYNPGAHFSVGSNKAVKSSRLQKKQALARARKDRFMMFLRYFVTRADVVIWKNITYGHGKKGEKIWPEKLSTNSKRESYQIRIRSASSNYRGDEEKLVGQRLESVDNRTINMEILRITFFCFCVYFQY